MNGSQRGVGSCSQVGCPVAETGECLNGLEPSKCPNFSPDPSEERDKDTQATMLPSEEQDDVTESSTPSEPLPVTSGARRKGIGVDLPSGEALVLAEVASIRAASLPRLVVITGPPSAGKTTIVISIYEALQFGELDEHLFCASVTLPALELRCFLNRPESGLEFPDTAHTQPSNEPRFLHLRTALSENPKVHTDVLFGDISGEDFEDIRNNSGVIERMEYLGIVDHLAVVVDGAALCAPGERDVAAMDSLQLVARFSASGHLPEDCEFHIVTSKMDLVEHRGGEDAVAFARALSARLVAAAEKKFARVKEHFVAARPVGPPPTDGKQLHSLYSSWVAYCRPLPGPEASE